MLCSRFLPGHANEALGKVHELDVGGDPGPTGADTFVPVLAGFADALETDAQLRGNVLECVPDELLDVSSSQGVICSRDNRIRRRFLDAGKCFALAGAMDAHERFEKPTISEGLCLW